MKKFIAVPAIAILAAAGAASAAGFSGGVSAGPLQTGATWDLECADSAQVTEWGFNDSAAVPFVSYAVVKLSNSTCQGQALHMISLKPDGTEDKRFDSGQIPSTLGSGDQYVRVYYASHPNSGVDAAELKRIRISVDPGYPSMNPLQGSNTRAGLPAPTN